MADWKENKLTKGSEGLDQTFPDYEVVDHRQFICTDVDENNNKFYSIELQKCSSGKHRVYTQYGRVANVDAGVVGVYGPSDESEMRSFMESKIKQKCRPSKGYNEVKTIRSKIGSPKARLIVRAVDGASIPAQAKKADDGKKKDAPKITLSAQVKKFIDQIYNDSSTAIKSSVNVNISKDGIETPLGVLSYEQLNTGKTILANLQKALASKKDAEVRQLNNSYFGAIPHTMGRKILDSDLLTTDPQIQHEFDILKLMEDSLEVGGAAYVSDTEHKYVELGATIDVLDKSDPEWKRVEKYIIGSKSHHHYYAPKVRNVYRVTLPHDRAKYDVCKIGNESELFHGSRNCNILGIIKRGLMIAPPEAPVSGAMFAKGLYFADQSSKSINYSMAAFGHMRNTDNCFLFLAKVKLGKILELEDANYQADKVCRSKGCDSVKGVKGRSLLHNEFIVYDTPQNTLTHVVELER